MDNELLEKIYSEVVAMRLDLIQLKMEKIEDNILNKPDYEENIEQIKQEILEKLEQMRMEILGIYDKYQDHTSLNDLKTDLDIIGNNINTIYANMKF